MVWQSRNRLSNRRVIVLLTLSLLLPLSAWAQSLIQSGLEYDAKGKPVAVVVTGKNSEAVEVYLGVSMYPSGISDILTQGVHTNTTIAAGESFSKRFILVDNNGDDFKRGTFEVALWGKKIMKKDAADPNYYFCKLWGFCFDKQKCYLSGTIMPLNSK